jgi:hypothetical protein
MAYFNHAFCKSWLAKGAAPSDLVLLMVDLGK